MKRYTLKMLVFVLTLALALPLLMTAASAKLPPDESIDVDGYVIWKLSKDGNTLTGNGKAYTYYETDIRSRIVTGKNYFYANGVDSKEGYNYYRVTSYEKSGDIVWLDSADFIYVTEEGRAHLDSFYSGESVEYVLYDRGAECAVNADLIDELAHASGKRETFSLPSLARYDEYVINATDSKGIVGYPVASVFCINDSLYYVDHEKLDNSYFDSYGDLSFRQGSIELVRLEGLTERKVINVINSASYPYYESEYEFDYEEYQETSIGFVWSLFVCPAGGIAAGVILPQSKKLGKPKKWYAVAALSGVMLLLSITLMMIQ